MASSDIESLQASLSLIVEVRSKAQELFKSVLEGSKEDGASGGQGATRETKYLSEVKLKLDTVGSKIKELETQIGKPQTNTSHPLAHGVYLNADSANESMALYQSLVTGYKWWNKAIDYAGGAALLLSQNNLKRSSGQIAKQNRGRRPGSNFHIAPPHALDNLINQISQLYKDMRFRVARPNGSKSNAIVEVTLDRLLTASLVFKGLMIEWVMVRGYDEPTNKDTRTDGSPDVWTESRYCVFRRITDNANAAMLNYFQSPLYPELAAKSFFTYLHSYVTLFTEKCRSCGYHLHSNLPPTWREFKTLDPYHEDCRR